MKLFKTLSEVEEMKYRQWARDNYSPLSEIKGIWHPTVQDECVKINSEHGGYDPTGPLEENDNNSI